MNESLPRPAARGAVSRQPAEFGDLLTMMGHHFRLHAAAVEFLGPFNARQRARSPMPYIPPTRDELKSCIKQGKVNDITYLSYINGIIRFCEKTRGTKALVTPHPSVIHSIQLPAPAFHISQVGGGVTMIDIPSAAPIKVTGIRDCGNIGLIIIRPKLGKLGTTSVKEWEVLFWKDNPGYLVEWVDADINPRYVGVM